MQSKNKLIATSSRLMSLSWNVANVCSEL